MHYLLTVFIEARHAATPERRERRAIELMHPFDEAITVAPYERDCWRLDYGDPHDRHCCSGTLKEWSTTNPRAKWDYWVLVGSGDSRWEDAVPGEPTYALLLPGEGWSDRRGYYGRMLGWDEQTPEWDAMFRAAFHRYHEQGFVPMLVDYHC